MDSDIHLFDKPFVKSQNDKFYGLFVLYGYILKLDLSIKNKSNSNFFIIKHEFVNNKVLLLIIKFCY